MVRAAALSLALVLTCGAASAQPMELTPMPEPATAGSMTRVPAPFSPSALQWSLAPGRGRITGDAILRTRGGEIRTCAATQVQLWPVSDYTRDNVAPYFTKWNQPIKSDALTRMLLGIDPRAMTFVRRTICNGQGGFSFDGLPAGEYLVVANVSWEVPNFGRGSSKMQEQGGYLATIVDLSAGQTATITLTQ